MTDEWTDEWTERWMNTWFFYYLAFLLFIIYVELGSALYQYCPNFLLIRISMFFGPILLFAPLYQYLWKKGYLKP